MNRTHSNPVKSTQDGREPIGIASAGLTLLTSVLWGGTPVAISYSVDTLPPIGVAALRFVFAAVFMIFWCRWEGSDLRLRSGQVVPVLLTGILLFVQIGLFHVGIEQSNSSHASLFINTFIIWVALIGHFVTKTDRLTLRKTSGLALAASGVFLVLATSDNFSPTKDQTALATASAVQGERRTVGNADDVSLIGDLIVLGSAVLLGIKVVYTKIALRTVEAGKLIFWHDIVGIGLFAAYSLCFEDFAISKVRGPALWGLVYQGFVVAGFCFAVQATLLRKHVASQLAVFSFTTPLFGILLAKLFRGDHLSPWLWVSALCVAVGILMVNATVPVRANDCER